MNHFPVDNHYPRPAVCFDYDGTLMDGDKPRLDYINLARRLQDEGWFVLVHSARPASHNRILWEKLADWSLLPEDIVCGSKPAADIFVDDRGLLLPPDALHEVIEARRQPLTERWAAYENPSNFMADWLRGTDGPDGTPMGHDGFRVAVLLSGGMDSTFLAWNARRLGLPCFGVYVDNGVEYTDREQNAIKAIAEHLDLQLVAVPGEAMQRSGDYFDIGRNPILVMKAAQQLHANDWWGQVWIGNVGDWQETPVYGGDKSIRFNVTMNQILTGLQYDITLAAPISTLPKHDLVSIMANAGDLDLMDMSYSCHTGTEGHCGTCRGCWRRWVAYGITGHPHDWPNGYDFHRYCEYFIANADDRSVLSAPGRTEPFRRFILDPDTSWSTP